MRQPSCSGTDPTGNAAEREKAMEAAVELGPEPEGKLTRPRSYEDAIHHSVEPQEGKR